ncbi:hypothetical protein JCM19000A_41570 [Silvimonas sp. JCM 19000]
MRKITCNEFQPAVERMLAGLPKTVEPTFFCPTGHIASGCKVEVKHAGSHEYILTATMAAAHTFLDHALHELDVQVCETAFRQVGFLSPWFRQLVCMLSLDRGYGLISPASTSDYGRKFMANLAVANLSFHELRRGLILVMEDDVVEYFGDFEALLTRHAHFGSETWFRTHRVAILPKN